jgi:aspartyl-tRNA(Asn)/glutamyl-tRNA(Gln) amidotransferase subunit B
MVTLKKSRVKAKGLTQIADEGAVVAMVEEALANNLKEVERFKAGEERLKQFFVGQVMKASRGKTNASSSTVCWTKS